MICLTFDTDHMSEEGMGEFLRRFPLPGKGTFFCHTAFAALAASGHEVAPHPYIGNLSAWQEDFRRLTSALPGKAAGLRPHSCVYSHMLGVELAQMGYRYISQATQLYSADLRPYRHPWGIWELPIYYMDNMDYWMPRNWPKLDHEPFSRKVIDTALADPDALFVFDLHPLHIALNTRTPEDYTAVKSRILDQRESPFALSAAGRGSRAFFEELCEAMRLSDVQSLSCAEVLEAYHCD